jgi:hypothetical protein
MGYLSREQRSASAAAELFGVPRYLYGEAARGMVQRAAEVLQLKKASAQGFAGELAVWDLAGILYGKHVYRPESLAEAAPESEPASSVLMIPDDNRLLCPVEQEEQRV